MYHYFNDSEGKISLHDCRTNHINYENDTLSFEFPDGFQLLGESEAVRSGKAKMECHMIDADLDGISVYIYRKTASGKVMREDWTDNFIAAVNEGTFEFEFVTTYRGYRRILFKGYVWFDKKPYSMECEIELCTDKIMYSCMDEIA